MQSVQETPRGSKRGLGLTLTLTLTLTPTLTLTLWLSDHEAKARCIEALRSLHLMNGMKKKSSSNLSISASHSSGSHCQVMPPPSPVVSSASSGKVQR